MLRWMDMRHGFALIDKPAGLTSHDVVARVRRILSEKHVGHLGTLDPAATGLLVVAVGSKALKVIEFFTGAWKEYEAHVRLGAVSQTYDREGPIEEWTPVPGWTVPEQGVINRVLADRFVGRITQVPPAHSAVKIGGVRAYQRARRQEEITMPPRQVEIEKCAVLSYEYPNLHLKIRCSSGTYIRSLAHDLGASLRCGGYLEALKRTVVGQWSLKDAVALADLKWTDVQPLKDSLKSLHGVELAMGDFDKLKLGQDVIGHVEPHTIGWVEGMPVAVLEPTPAGRIHARKVL